MWSYYFCKPDQTIEKNLTNESKEKFLSLKDPIMFIRIKNEHDLFDVNYLYWILNKERFSIKDFYKLFIIKNTKKLEKTSSSMIDPTFQKIKESDSNDLLIIDFIEEKDFLNVLTKQKNQLKEICLFDFSKHSESELMEKEKMFTLFDHLVGFKLPFNGKLTIDKNLKENYERSFFEYKLSYNFLPVEIKLTNKEFIRELLKQIVLEEYSKKNEDERTNGFKVKFLSKNFNKDHSFNNKILEEINEWINNEEVNSYLILLNSEYSDDFSLTDWSIHEFKIIDNTFFQ